MGDSCDRTALHYASAKGYEDVAHALLAHPVPRVVYGEQQVEAWGKALVFIEFRSALMRNPSISGVPFARFTANCPCLPAKAKMPIALGTN